jgi:hypothetical protein
MRFIKTAGTGRVALCAAVLIGVLAAPVSGASASDASIKAVIKSYNAKLLIADGHLATALGEYKKSGDPSGVQAALKKSIAVIGALKSKIASQKASNPRVKQGQAKFDRGLQAIVVAYKRLSTAIGEKQVSPAAAKAEAKKAVTAIDRARVLFKEGAKLLG